MLRLQNSQLDVLNDEQRRQFQLRLHEHLQRYFPDELPAAALDWDALFRHGMQEARRYKLQLEANITIFFNIMMSIGPAFATERAWAEPILKDHRLHENEKIRRLIRHTEETLESDNNHNIQQV